MAHLIRTAAVTLSALLTLLCGAASAQTSIKLKAQELDSLYPGTCVPPHGCFPSLIPDGSGGSTLGFTGGETIVAWRDVTFPSNPLRIDIEYGSPQTSSVDFYFNGGTNDPDAIMFWMCDLPLTGDYATVNTSTCTLDYGVLGDIDLSGTHDLFLGFRCMSSGCGNYKSVTFHFDANATAGTPTARPRSASALSTTRIMTTGAWTTSAGSADPRSVMLYDMRGRTMGSLAAVRSDRHVGSPTSGIAITRVIR